MTDAAATAEHEPAAAPSDAGSRSAIRATLVVGVLGVALVLRWWTRSDLWLDEALSVNIARLPLSSIGTWLRHDGAPPLYYWMLHIWTGWFGTGDLAVRSLSSVFGVLALPAAWACARKLGGRRLAWVATLLLASNPYAVRYATETRMYGLEILLVFLGILAVRSAVDRPSPARLTGVAVVSAALVWTHYWCLSFVAAAWIVVVLVAWRSSAQLRANATRTAVAIAFGAASFVVWIPNFLYQSGHTGTPWAVPQVPVLPLATSLFDFSGGWRTEGWMLFYAATLLLALGAVGRHAGRGAVALDVHVRSEVWPEAVVGVLGLGLGATVAYIGGSGFQSRYSAAVLPCFVLVMARGVTVLGDRRVQSVVLAVLVACGLVGGARNVTTARTQAGDAARAIAARAHPGDVVVYCPDQLGPATHRVLARYRIASRLVERSYPVVTAASRSVELVDWVDYVERLDRVAPERAATATLDLAGATATVWVVTSPGYITHDGRCMPFVQAIAHQGRRTPREVVTIDPEIYEHAGVYELAP